MSALPVTEQRRQFQRITLDGEVRLYSERAMWTAKLCDISLRGAAIERPDGWDGQRGKTQRLEIRLGGAVSISVTASVAHCSERRVGYKFEKIDLASFTRLRRLVELNLGDAELLKRELSALDQQVVRT